MTSPCVRFALALSFALLIGWAPAPWLRREQPPPLSMEGTWALTFNGNEWAVWLTQDDDQGGRYWAVSPVTDNAWRGHWKRTAWGDTFAIYESPPNSQSVHSFPVRYDGQPMVVPSGGDDRGRGPDWTDWTYRGSRVSIRRVRR